MVKAGRRPPEGLGLDNGAATDPASHHRPGPPTRGSHLPSPVNPANRRTTYGVTRTSGWTYHAERPSIPEFVRNHDGIPNILWLVSKRANSSGVQMCRTTKARWLTFQSPSP